MGLNNDWNTALILNKKKDGSFVTDINLPKASTHQFKYRINNTDWVNEPNADAEEANAFGGTNSVISL